MRKKSPQVLKNKIVSHNSGEMFKTINEFKTDLSSSFL
jgi:hypothetical protein